MNKKLICITVFVTTSVLYSMEPKKNPKTLQAALQVIQTAQPPKIIFVSHPQTTALFEYDQNTTIGDIKNKLYDREGIPTGQQRLVATKNEGFSGFAVFGGFVKSRSDSLSDDKTVANVVDTFDTNNLELSIKLLNPHIATSSNSSDNK
ncbi:MAG: ubiquitin-like domain-containing protein [Candidatus Babeliales bacterium]